MHLPNFVGDHVATEECADVLTAGIGEGLGSVGFTFIPQVGLNGVSAVLCRILGAYTEHVRAGGGAV